MRHYTTKNDCLNSKYTIIDRLKTCLERCKNQTCERNYLKTYLSLGEKYNKVMNEYELDMWTSMNINRILHIYVSRRRKKSDR